MNVFYLDSDPKLAAIYHNDKHVVKMILETAQIMSTVANGFGFDTQYRPTHKNHPCTLWAAESNGNYAWLRDLARHLNNEYRFRWQKDVDHKSWSVIQDLPDHFSIPDRFTQPAQAMPDNFKHEDAVEAYRRYYRYGKTNLAKWTKRQTPFWWEHIRL